MSVGDCLLGFFVWFFFLTRHISSVVFRDSAPRMASAKQMDDAQMTGSPSEVVVASLSECFAPNQSL